MTYPLGQLRKQVVGIDTEIPLLDETAARYVNFDNAASTPVVRPVLDKVNEFMNWYSSIHRGTGFKSWLSTKIYDESREMVAGFVGADMEHDVVIYTANTTDSVNRLAETLDFSGRRDTVLLSMMEHHSNELPWRYRADTVVIPVDSSGRLDLDFVRDFLRKEGHRTALLAVTGASNTTGFLNPVHTLAEMAHEYGVMIAVDAAQLVPHRRVEMLPADDPGHLDFLYFSAHKMYAPFGTGVLIGPREIFLRGRPVRVGGGVVDCVCRDEVLWTDLPEREEAGTPNVVGAVALAEAVKFIQSIGYDSLTAHEEELTRTLLAGFARRDGIVVYGSSDPDEAGDRLGVIPFNVKDVPHGLVAEILSLEGGIGVRNGCFCAHPYMKTILGVSPEEERQMVERLRNHDKMSLPGMVRVSFGFYNSVEEVERLLVVLDTILSGSFEGSYRPSERSGVYYADHFNPDPEDFFAW